MQFTSTPVRRQRRSQQGDVGKRNKKKRKRNSARKVVPVPPPPSTWCVCRHCLPACRNWHNCQVSVRQRSRVSSWRAPRPRVIKGTCFWRRSRGRASMSGATARLIKWLPLISAMHMKGLCLLHDRFGASSPRDLPGYTSGGAARKEEKKIKKKEKETTMYRAHGLVLTQILLMFFSRARASPSCCFSRRHAFLLLPFIGSRRIWSPATITSIICGEHLM